MTVHRHLIYRVIVGVLALGFGSKSWASECTLSPAKLALHVTSTETTICGSQVACSSSSNNITTITVGSEWLIHVILYLPDQMSFTSVQFGVYYHTAPGIGFDVLEFHSCSASTTPIGDWPDAYGSQILMTYPSCQTFDETEGIELGWFRVRVGSDSPPTRDTFSLRPLELFGSGEIPPRLVDCDQNETLIPPQNVGEVSFLNGPGFDPCSGSIGTYVGTCCFGDSCQVETDLACCWANQGSYIGPNTTCTNCIVKVFPNTWGQLKSRYE
jgi:hypothetical protein